MENEEPQEGSIVLYQADGRNVPVQVTYKDETFWMTQKGMAELFGVDSDTISVHLRNIYKEGELVKDATTEILSVVRNEGGRTVRRSLTFYNLDAIIAVGYRVNSKQATQFRIWATGVLHEYIVKGFALNDDMLKNGRPFGDDYFEELLARIRDIRTSERRFYQKITDLFSEVSWDYDPKSQTARDFFASFQNKMHYAITGLTAAEIITSRVDSSKANMGLTNWKGSPKGHPHAGDVAIAKNYLSKDELEALNTLTTGLLDLTEARVRRHTLTSMSECAELIDQYLRLAGMPLLEGKGNRGHKQAVDKAMDEYRKWDKTRENDFDKFVKGVEDGEPR